MSKHYCKHCKDKKDYFILENIKAKKIQGKRSRYCHKSAICIDCNNQIFINELDFENFKKVYENISPR